jgi:hypothetical protein
MKIRSTILQLFRADRHNRFSTFRCERAENINTNYNNCVTNYISLPDLLIILYVSNWRVAIIIRLQM